jgi:hypothetical protein
MAKKRNTKAMNGRSTSTLQRIITTAYQEAARAFAANTLDVDLPFIGTKKRTTVTLPADFDFNARYHDTRTQRFIHRYVAVELFATVGIGFAPRIYQTGDVCPPSTYVAGEFDIPKLIGSDENNPRYHDDFEPAYQLSYTDALNYMRVPSVGHCIAAIAHLVLIQGVVTQAEYRKVISDTLAADDARTTATATATREVVKGLNSLRN